MWAVSDSSQLVVCHSRLLAVLDNLAFMESDCWPRKNVVVHQPSNVSHKNRDFETFMKNVFFDSNSSPPPGAFSRIHISQKIVFFTLESLFRHPEQKNWFFEENTFSIPEVCSFDLDGNTSPPRFGPSYIIESSTSTKIETLMFSIKTCFFYPTSRQSSRQFPPKNLLYKQENKIC